MFPLRWNFPFRKKDGSMVNLEDAMSGGGGGYTLPTASADVKGGVKIGDGLQMVGEVLSAIGGSGGSCHLYHGTTNNGWLKEFYILSSVDYNETSVPVNQIRNILFNGVGFIVPHADGQYNSTGRIPTFLTISSATASKFTIVTMDLVIDNSAIKYTKAVAEPEYSYIASQFSMTKIF